MTMTKTIKDRNLVAYLLANGFTCTFAPRPGTSELDAVFPWSEALDHSCMDYTGNRGVPVQSFVAACRFIGEKIKAHRQGGTR
ncbi:hypothetical protein FO488_03425 [Geobacter sp. FeAm09]|uniref:hypothetical protein n=1 Tax=Geobacter sp. FeAm09 TaxID=2597769 RepID=UPI0011EECDC8|nr:hypothetical protein [Geobacter sp. FeAm09]QEM67295.1 hypothetical protein FO488_03425 [Geobacter sp. FeAm09]